MDTRNISVGKFRGIFLGLGVTLRWCLISMGRVAMVMKMGRDFGGSIEIGPMSKEKRRSLKLASQVKRKVVCPTAKAEERE